MKGFVNENGRPYNYLKSEAELSVAFESSLVTKFVTKEFLNEIKTNSAVQSCNKFQHEEFKRNVESFGAVAKEEKQKREIELQNYQNNRQFITEVFYEVLDDGLRNMRLLDPSDPFEFLVS